ncbi:MAG: tolB protein precursor, partial [Mucilaginibacter sp.]
GGQFIYINQEGRWDFGVGVSHIPFQYGIYNNTYPTKNINGHNVTVQSQNTDILRNFQDAAQVFTAYPFSKTTRIQFGGGATVNYYRVDRYSDYYSLDTITVNNVQRINSTFIGSDKTKVSNSDEGKLLGTTLRSYTLFSVNTALIGDNSFFGVASPLNGFRYRLEAEYNFGTYHFFAPTIDVRKYIRVEPVTFAARLLGYGRFGQVDGLYPQFIGYPFYIRGYEAQTFYNSTNKARSNGFNINELSGNNLAVANFEVRLPFTGPEKLSQFKSKFFFSELNLFFDAGLAWNTGDKIYLQKNPPVIGSTPALDENGNQQIQNGQLITNPVYGRIPALSAGISLRVNIFGYFVLEPYLAVPFNRTDISKPVFGLGFTPGW